MRDRSRAFLNGLGLDAIVIASGELSLSFGQGEPAGRQAYVHRKADGFVFGRMWELIEIAERNGLV